MYRIRNIIQAKNLVKKYRSITIEQLLEVNKGKKFGYMAGVLSKITGYGSMETCRMCKVNGKTSDNCCGCIYFELTNGDDCCDHYTYDDINKARTIQELHNAIMARADYIESIIPLAMEHNKEWKKTSEVIIKDTATCPLWEENNGKD